MKKKTYFQSTILFLFGFLFSLTALATQESQIAPPDVKLVDEFGVNIATRQVMVSVDTVAIGGELGLSHNISGETNLFSHIGQYGYLDKYAGTAKYMLIGINNVRLVRNGTAYNHPVYVMRVFGPVGSQDFMVVQNGSHVHNANNLTGQFEYVALGDTRHTLEKNVGDARLVWTTDDGTVLKYGGGTQSSASQGAALKQIIYPNGFTVDIEFRGVSTNTGYMLKYFYEGHGAISGTDLAYANNIRNNFPTNIPIPDPWSKNPTKISGINLANQYCSISAFSCSDTGWPNAQFTWPNGMPTKMYLNNTGNTGVQGKNVFSIVDQLGRTTELFYQAQNACLRYVEDPNSMDDSCSPNAQYWAPRLVEVKSANSEVADRVYKYQNDFGPTPVHNFYWVLNSYTGLIQNAEGVNGTAGYSIEASSPNPGPDISYTASTGNVVLDGHMSGKLYSVNLTKDGIYTFEHDYRNFVESYTPIAGPKKNYSYDARGNLYQITETSRDHSATRTLLADYPDTCTNRKTCNKPTWTKDYLGNQTDYEYNSLGQVTKITGPADEKNIRPQTRYAYTPLYAYYKKSGETIEQADSPISMLTREAYCRTTAASGNGCAGGALDEVVTEYYYGPQQNGVANNLHLRGVSVTAEGDDGLETRVTCYEYDKYGNRIGETSPLGNLDKDSASDCP